MTNPTPDRTDQVVALGMRNPDKSPEACLDTLPAMGLASAPKLAAEPPDRTEFLTIAALDILDKQYRLYAWNDTKTIALITTNSLLFAAMGFIYKEALRETLAIACLGAAGLSLMFSLGMCLLQVVPRFTSGESDVPIRSLRGIQSFRPWTAYYEEFKKIEEKNLLRDTVRQFYGMAKNNCRSINIIKFGVIFTLFGVCLMAAATGISASAARGIHILGPWETPNVTAIHPQIARPTMKKK